jgi:hypothetical protein
MKTTNEKHDTKNFTAVVGRALRRDGKVVAEKP